MHLFIPNYSLKYAKRLLTWLQGKQKCLCVAWIINWALQIDCNTRVRYGANKLVSKVGIETDLRVLQKIYIILYSFCILSKSFTRPFEVKQLPSPQSCSSKHGNYLLLISNDEKWLSLKKIFWKIYHHSKCFNRYYRSFVSSSSINIQEALRLKVSSLKNEKYLSSTLIRSMHLFILNYALQYAKRIEI